MEERFKIFISNNFTIINLKFDTVFAFPEEDVNDFNREIILDMEDENIIYYDASGYWVLYEEFFEDFETNTANSP